MKPIKKQSKKPHVNVGVVGADHSLGTLAAALANKASVSAKVSSGHQQTGRFVYDCDQRSLNLEFDEPRVRSVYVKPEVEMEVALGDNRRIHGITLVVNEAGQVGAIFED